MRKVFLFYCLIFTNLMVFAQAKTYSDLQNELTKLPEFKNASLGLYAVNLSTGDKVFDYNSQTSLAPASVFKIIPTALAIELLGPDYKFKTELAYSGSISSDGVLNGNIYVIGYGDPCLGSQNFAYHYNSNGELSRKIHK